MPVSPLVVVAAPPRAGERPLDAVRRFLNSRRIEEGVDRLLDPEDARAWLTDQGYQPALLGERRLAAYRTAREEIRGLLAGEPGGVERVDALLARHAGAVPAIVGADGATVGGVRARAVAPELQPLQAILLALWRGAASGELERLKVCADDRCRLAFYDRSRNRSRTWCTSGECGNRNRLTRHRARHRRQPG